MAEAPAPDAARGRPARGRGAGRRGRGGRSGRAAAPRTPTAQPLDAMGMFVSPVVAEGAAACSARRWSASATATSSAACASCADDRECRHRHAPRLDPHDPLGIEGLLSDEERAGRDEVRRFVEERFAPDAERLFEDARWPRELAGELGRLGVLGMHLDGYGCAGASAVAVWPRVPGARGRRQRPADVRLRPGLARHDGDPHLGLRGAEAALAAGAGGRRSGRLLRPDRAAGRQQPGRDAHDRPPRRRRLDPGAARSAGSAWAASPTSPSSGHATATACRGLSRPRRDARSAGAGHHRQARAARLAAVRAALRELPPARRRDAAGRRGPARPVHVAQRGALRRRLGRRRRGALAATRRRSRHAGEREQFGGRSPRFQLVQARSSPTWRGGCPGHALALSPRRA